MSNFKKNDKSIEDKENSFNTEMKPCTFELELQLLSNKIYELEFLERISAEAEKKLRDKEKEVKDKKQKSEELEYEMWRRMESFCERIWQFSASNDLWAILNKYLDASKSISQKFVSFDIELDADVINLKNENAALKEQLTKKQLFLVKLREDLIETEFNDSEIIRLKKSIETLENALLNPAVKLRRVDEIFVNNRCDETSDSGDKKSNFATAAELIEKSKNHDVTKRHYEKTKFSVKKESQISRRLANIRGSHRRD